MMKILQVAILFFFKINFLLYSQNKVAIPDLELKTIDGKVFNVALINKYNKIVILDFWATWCKPCILELNAISEVYEEWKKEFNVELIAVSVDDSKSVGRVLPFVKSKGWNFTVLYDTNGDFKRIMNVINIPHLFIIDGNGNIVYQHTTYSEGVENEIYRVLKKIKEKSNN
ncbi:MAG: TlpA family protein disulfide reductase [Bacteroidales bacterium]|nr:TlpA family protein disulfide reductase [Bacteroidales bacterium]